MLAWRNAQKVKTAFADKLPAHINANTGRVHTTFKPTGARTGRLSSSEPNLQQIPAQGDRGRRMRGAFVADPGNLLVAADYSQIELRILAHASSDPGLIEAFRGGYDFHTATAAKLFGVRVDKVDKELRRRAKAVNFGIVYGSTQFGLAREIGISQDEAQAIINSYFSAYPRVREYMELMRETAASEKAVRILFGRKVHVPDIESLDPKRRSKARNLAVNAPIQGSGADLIRRAMVRMPPALAEAGLGARTLLTVHDELVFEVPEVDAERAGAVIKHAMETAGTPDVNFCVPILVEVRAGPTWAEAH